MKLHSLLLRITTLFLLGGIISCSEDSTDPVPVPDPTVMFRLTIGEPNYVGNYAVLFTDTENTLLEFLEVEPGGNYEFDLSGYEKFSVHIALYDAEKFQLRSYMGYNEDTLHVDGYPDFEFGNEIRRLPIKFNTEIVPWILQAGLFYQNNYGTYYQTAGRFFENADMLYFIRDEFDKDENDGYLFIENFDFDGDTLRIGQEDLSPLSDLVLLDYDFTNDFSDFSPYIIMKATPEDRDGRLQYPITIFETPSTNASEKPEIRVPDFDVFKSFETRAAIGESLSTGKYYFVDHTSYYRGDHPGVPSLIEGDLEIQDATPGTFRLSGTGQYSHLEYTIYTPDISWFVTIYDESVDYSSYPSFPDTFFETTPHGTLENLKVEVELKEPSTHINGSLVQISGNETRYLTKSIRL